MTFTTLEPCRLVDTRNPDGELGGPPLIAQEDRVFALGETCAIDAAALALSVNITAVEATAAGHLNLRASGEPASETWTVSYNAQQNRASQAMVALGAGGDISVYCDQPEGRVGLVLDVNGYFRAACGDGATLPPETCDGDCGECDPPQLCQGSSGGAASCDLVCKLDVTACNAEKADNCCPYAAGCEISSDADCTGPRWERLELSDLAGEPCTTIRIYGIEAGGSYMLTTCSPDGGGTGDPGITSVVDNTARSYPVSDLDCLNPLAIPHAEGWNCRTADGPGLNACTGNNTGGFVAGEGAASFDITVCNADGGSFTAPFHIFYNASTAPNEG